MEYTNAQRLLQGRFDSQRVADYSLRGVTDRVEPRDRTVIEAAPFFFLSTVDTSGRPTCSYKGGLPGFVQVPEPRVVAFPSYDGNGMFLSAGNISDTGRVALLFVDFAEQIILRIHGRAHIVSAAADAAGSVAQFAVRVDVDEVFRNCPRYIHRMALEAYSTFAPSGDAKQQIPKPEWKRIAVAECGTAVLPAGDTALEAGARFVHRDLPNAADSDN